MNKNNVIDPKPLFIDLNYKSNDNSISEKIAELKNAGHSKIKLEVNGSSEKENTNLKIDTDLFIKIKSIQELPDWVIIKLILANGKLKGSKFTEQIHIG